MGCGESKHAVATENTISKSKSKKSDSKRIAENSVEEKEKLIKEPGVDGNAEERIAENSVEKKEKLIKEPGVDGNVGERESLEEGKVNAKVTDNGNGESKVEESVKERESLEEGKENANVEQEKKGGNAKTTDNGNGKSEGEENANEKEEKLDARVVVVEENKEGKSDEISVHQEVAVDVQEPDAEKLKRGKESIIPEENVSEGKTDLNDNVEGKEIIEEAKEESKTEEAIKVEEAKEVKEEVVLPTSEAEDSATKKE